MEIPGHLASMIVMHACYMLGEISGTIFIVSGTVGQNKNLQDNPANSGTVGNYTQNDDIPNINYT